MAYSMKDCWAYDFECDKPMAEILAILNQAGTWKWMEWDSDTFGPYIYSVPLTGLKVRLYDLDGYYSNGPTYTADFIMDESCETDRPAIDRVFLALLPKLTAHNVTKGIYYD